MTSQKCGAFFYDVALLWISSDVASLYGSKKQAAITSAINIHYKGPVNKFISSEFNGHSFFLFYEIKALGYF
jgi:hypothetical protein